MNERTNLDEVLFSTALALPIEERHLYLQRACTDAGMHARVQALLDSVDEGTALFKAELSADADGTADVQVDNYRVLQEIGEGGWGTVFLAEQFLPVRREVALKIIKLGMDTKAVIQRFSAERQAVAMMSHPNIAKVLDAGATRAGRPYFAMELVRGIKITDYCDLTRSSIAERIALFLQVCQAIHHAHRKGVIHRDIKPSNVMVTLVDGTPVAKVIDFGVAKAVQGRLTDGTLFTAFDHFIGTPAYVSPEQAERGDAQTSPRSDIYSLGVLLYELLCGCTPFAGNDLSSSRTSLLRARLRSDDPLPPSRKLRELSAEAIAQVVERSRTSRSRLISDVQGDLDWIILRCLEQDPGKRYASALELSLDLQRFMRDEPVVARPRRLVYSLRKFAKRHRAVVVTSTALVAILLSTTLLTSWLAVRAARANELTQSVVNFLQNDLLIQDELDRPDTELKLLTVLDRAAVKVQARFGAEPLLEASVRSTLATAYASVGAEERSERELVRARQIYEEQYGLHDRRTLEAMRRVVVTKARQQQYSAAERLGLQTLQHASRALGEQDRQYLTLATTVALVQLEELKFDEARKTVRHLVDAQKRVWGPEHPTTLDSMWIQAAIALADRDLSRAETLARTVLDARKRRLGHRHRETINARVLLQLIYLRSGKCGPWEQHLEPRALETIVTMGIRSLGRNVFEQRLFVGFAEACSVEEPKALGR
jgi:eukaryotic-like serine/threonine-protein kinase